MIIHRCDQYSPEWWAIHEGKMGASHAQAIAANGAGLKTYIRDDIMGPKYSKADKKSYSNKSMERGLELEPSAAMVYEFTTGILLKEVGFVEYNDFIGVSPDRLAGEDGLVEIKCPEDKAYFNLLLDEKIDSKYYWQMQMQMLVCEKVWCDYVCYNPNYDQSLFIKRVLPDKEKFDKLLKGFKSGIEMIKEIKTKMEAK